MAVVLRAEREVVPELGVPLYGCVSSELDIGVRYESR